VTESVGDAVALRTAGIHVPGTRDVVHVDEVKHAPSVSQLRGIVEVRSREDATVTFIPMFWGYDEPRVANLRRGGVG